MMISALGAGGAGLFWGWFIGTRLRHVRHRIANWLLAFGTTVIFATEIFLITGLQSGAVFLGSTASALVSYTGWLEWLKTRLMPSRLLE